FLWCRLPEGIDAADVARAALGHGIVLAPGNAFSVAQSAGNYLRFNVSQCQDERVFTVLEAAIGLAARPDKARSASPW
ncbi:MAG TPA: PLP-dependent aminotransferase family protein, partial [Kaistia sp.]|nr:PLP-dependent aminotransferase family protein [Kaistia sp.]